MKHNPASPIAVTGYCVWKRLIRETLHRLDFFFFYTSGKSSHCCPVYWYVHVEHVPSVQTHRPPPKVCRRPRWWPQLHRHQIGKAWIGLYSFKRGQCVDAVGVVLPKQHSKKKLNQAKLFTAMQLDIIFQSTASACHIHTWCVSAVYLVVIKIVNFPVRCLVNFQTDLLLRSSFLDCISLLCLFHFQVFWSRCKVLHVF